jgi:hypothetical protein
MHFLFRVTAAFLVFGMPGLAASKPHVITFGKAIVVKAPTGSEQSSSADWKIRPVYVDGRLKEFTVGNSHEVTEQLFVVRRMVRLNDTLPQEPTSTPRWSWQGGGWLLIDRGTGHISQVSLPEFDPDSSSATWYRDYVAYCGISDDGHKLSAIVMQLGRRKPILKKSLGEAADDSSAAECAPPGWQRAPTRVSFISKAGQRLTFAVRGHTVEVVSDDTEEATD